MNFFDFIGKSNSTLEGYILLSNSNPAIWGGFLMRKHEFYTDYQEHFEYSGNTKIEGYRIKSKKTIRHVWIIFDSVDEAMDCFKFEFPAAWQRPQ